MLRASLRDSTLSSISTKEGTRSKWEDKKSKGKIKEEGEEASRSTREAKAKEKQAEEADKRGEKEEKEESEGVRNKVSFILIERAINFAIEKVSTILLGVSDITILGTIIT